MEGPASTKVRSATTCCGLASGSAGTVDASDVHPNASLPVAHAVKGACDDESARRECSPGAAGSSRSSCSNGEEERPKLAARDHVGGKRAEPEVPGRAASLLGDALAFAQSAPYCVGEEWEAASCGHTKAHAAAPDHRVALHASDTRHFLTNRRERPPQRASS